MLGAGELPGWVRQVMGHASLKMVLERYHAYIRNYLRDVGAAFMKNVYAPSLESESDGEPQLGAGNWFLHQIYTKRRRGFYPLCNLLNG